MTTQSFKKQIISAIVVGYGDRGEQYAKYALNNTDLKIVGVVDPSEFRRNLAKERFSIKDDMVFSNLNDLLKMGKSADAIINATMDTLHIETALPLLEQGYDMLLEKPICNNQEQLQMLQDCAIKNNASVYICHVLRYTPFYLSIKKLVLSGEIGEIIHIETSEAVGVAHASSSYIRGKWNNSEKCGSSMLLAKCCHDMDILCWLTQSKPKYVSSFGGRYFFTKENAPKGSGERCLKDCPQSIEEKCPYSAKKIYLDNNPFSQYSWGELKKADNEITYEDRLNSIKESNPLGRCIFKTDMNIVDRQVLAIEFEKGITASHSMLCGISRPGRKIHIYGTKGEIEGFLEDSKFKVRQYNASNLLFDEKEIEIGDIDLTDGHMGGDSRMVRDFVLALKGGEQTVSLTPLSDSINSHICVYSADESMRIKNTIKI